jgi:hypothetical protein
MPPYTSLCICCWTPTIVGDVLGGTDPSVRRSGGSVSELQRREMTGRLATIGLGRV